MQAPVLLLFAHGMVLPVLDGLDEMDPSFGGTPSAQVPFACGVLGQLSGYRDFDRPAPLGVFSCTRHCNARPVVGTLVEAARITLVPVGTFAATAYLSARTRDLPRRPPSWPVALCAGVLSVLVDRLAVLT
ncbi:hypothetical protein ACFYW8_41465 [Streptomyces sp. NPDC002742]|uniref:hypothetical protein n=1 Tax=Streptomyces sp. NPDC002742 TaxID=3364663 RepID=UPI0036AC4A13